MRLIDADTCWDRVLNGCCYTTESAIMGTPTIDPVHVAGGCYCVECRYKDDCIRRIEFIGRNPVLEQNTCEYHPLSFCSYGQRKIETVLPKNDVKDEREEKK